MRAAHKCVNLSLTYSENGSERAHRAESFKRRIYYNKGIKKVYIPVSNKNDLKEIPKKILDKLEIKLVTNFKEIYQDLF